MRHAVGKSLSRRTQAVKPAPAGIGRALQRCRPRRIDHAPDV